MKNNRGSIRWRVRRLLGSWCNHLAHRLLDPHDSWMIDYRDADGHECCRVVTGLYSTAMAAAREMNGKVVGCQVTTIRETDDYGRINP